MKIHKILFIVILYFLATGALAQEIKIKFATLAPEGSTWMKVMKEFDRAVRQQSNGRLGFKIYAGGILGDEKDVLRKIRLGQLHAAGFTGVGMGEILPEVRILDCPFLFRSYDEIDYINTKFYQRFARGFEKKGYVLLSWAEVGFVYVFSKSPIRSIEDMRKIKMWIWEGDPVAEATFKAFNLHPFPLSVIDVMPALQANMIDGVYTSPLAAIALQWFTKVKYMMELPLANSAGAVLISKRKYDQLSPDLQKILSENARHYMAKLITLSRKDNAKAIETLKKSGINIVPISNKKTMLQYEEIGKKARRLLVGKLFSQQLLTEVETALAEYRAKHSNKTTN
ncbi:TRAP transporter substrate-binding protein DctP [bacterium]|nr:TRAP transporter substrate-binding protein DctP [bacterium]